LLSPTFDNDGWQDLYVTGFGGSVLYRNKGNCQFEDVTEQAGVAVDGFPTGAAWGDYDRDGLVDLFVPRYAHVVTCAVRLILDGLEPGYIVEFTLVVDGQTSYAEHVTLRPYYFRRTGSLGGSRIEAACESHKQEQAGAKSFVDRTASSEFTLTDQSHHQISLVQFAGKVVAVNFIYTSCALPNYCFVSPITLECFSDGSKTS
jgi:hypothetical protein